MSKETDIPSRTGSASLRDLNFKVDPAFHRRFKLEAVMRSLSMKELLEASFKTYLEQHGGSLEAPCADLI